MEIKKIITDLLERLDETRLKNVYFFIRGMLELK